MAVGDTGETLDDWYAEVLGDEQTSRPGGAATVAACVSPGG